MRKISNTVWQKLSEKAWNARENAYLIGKTKVGCALYADNNSYHIGCNVEHKFRCHDIHAEVNAISSMIASGQKSFKCILIVAQRNNFTPCGSCMDWVMQHGGADCFVGFQNTKEGEITKYSAKELMPHYPS